MAAVCAAPSPVEFEEMGYWASEHLGRELLELRKAASKQREAELDLQVQMVNAILAAIGRLAGRVI